MRYINISELRQHLPTVLDSIAKSGEGLLVTKRNRAVVKILPVSTTDEGDDAHPLRAVPIELAKDFDEPLLDSLEEPPR